MIGVTAQYFARPDEDERYNGLAQAFAQAFAPVDVKAESA